MRRTFASMLCAAILTWAAPARAEDDGKGLLEAARGLHVQEEWPVMQEAPGFFSSLWERHRMHLR